MGLLDNIGWEDAFLPGYNVTKNAITGHGGFENIPGLSDIQRGLENTINELTGHSEKAKAAAAARGASETAAQSQRDAAELRLQGMREQMAALQAQLNPLMQFGMQTANQYRDMALNPNLDATRRERDESSANLSAQLAGMGLHNSSFNAHQQALLQSDYASKMYAQRMAALQPLLGFGPSAAHSLASGMGSAIGQGYGGAANDLAQAGYYTAQGQGVTTPSALGDFLRFGASMAPAAIGAFAGPGAGLAAAGASAGLSAGQNGMLNDPNAFNLGQPKGYQGYTQGSSSAMGGYPSYQLNQGRGY